MSGERTLWDVDRGRGARRWRLSKHTTSISVHLLGGSTTFEGDELTRLSTQRGWFRYSLFIRGFEPSRLKGLRRPEALELEAAVRRAIARSRATPALEALVKWHLWVRSAVASATEQRRWITREAREEFEAAKPDDAAIAELRETSGPDWPDVLTESETLAVEFHESDLEAWIAQLNEWILDRETAEQWDFFEHVESKPLTDEQVRAVVCMDNRVHVVAAAGSGKTSVMVARAAYAVMRGFVAPERILLLAFNTATAAELQTRVNRGMKVLGLSAKGLKATTFHSFGLGLIARATGKKPRVAPWVGDGQDVAMVCRIVDDLRDQSDDFAYRWDLFRLLYAHVSEKPDGGDRDGYDKQTRRTGFKTVNGEVVKSEGERIIADWLFFNGVSYEYEKPYLVDTADAEHSRYRPDFYYPDIDAWHEHWALDADGKAPASFVGYADAMQWKRRLHRQHDTTLIETTWAEIIDYSGLIGLATKLTELGLELDWNPDRKGPGARPLEHEALARLVRTFMTHAKSNSLNWNDLVLRIEPRSWPALIPRARLFVDIYWSIYEEWEARLKADDLVDFEDMLVQAAAQLESDPASSTYDLVLVDEFQDASQARARMTRALVDSPGKYLLAVGDDWQSINRFAGADISVMTRFQQWFGSGPTLRLQTTFRCPQSISDVASEFVSQNPRQLNKRVDSAQPGRGKPITVIRTADPDSIPSVLEECLKRITTAGADSKQPSVDVLGRYRFDRGLMPPSTPVELEVNFRTVHGSKGLEADHIIIPNLSRGRYGFPSNIEDDPVLNLAMVDADPHPHAEERRLFYVALTRARREVTLIVAAGQESPFVVELMKRSDVLVIDESGGADVSVCPLCGDGTLVERKGPYSSFLGCSTFPKCRHTESLE